MKYHEQHASPRNPFELYFLGFLVVATLPIALGKVPTPGSIDALLDDRIRHIWSWMMCGGAFGALVGVAWPRPRGSRIGRVATTGIVLEQIGLVAVAGGCAIYAGALAWVMLNTQRLDGLVAFGLVAALVAACLRRYFQLQGQLRDEEHRQDAPPQEV